MKKLTFLLLIFLLGAVLFAQNRYALVIGNALYSDPSISGLQSAIKDTEDIARKLEALGFEAVIKHDLQYLDMTAEIDEFIKLLRADRNSEGFFWYSGHQIVIENENYLMPVDVNLDSKNTARSNSISVSRLVNNLEKVQNKINLVVVDACRLPPETREETSSNPDRESTSLAIAPVTYIPRNTTIFYSAEFMYETVTEVTDEEPDENSPFTKAFLEYIESPAPLTQVLVHVRNETMRLTQGQQIPNYTCSLSDSPYTLNPDGEQSGLQSAPDASSAVPGNFIFIQGGTFNMGSPSNEPGRYDNETQHRVTVGSFYISKYQVMQKEYQAMMGANPSFFGGANLPVENVSWYDAIEYCNALSEKEGLTPAYTIDKDTSDPNNRSERDDLRWLVTWNRSANGYRLPTEAEWEYACRAGTATPFNTGDNITTANANYNGYHPYNNNPKGAFRERTTNTGSFAPNDLGLYEMHGNVFEWCWDWYGTYSPNAQNNPAGAVYGTNRVLRGGSWDVYGRNLRSAVRAYNSPAARVNYDGFRLVRNAN